VAENHQRSGFVLSPAHHCLKLGQERLADRVALVRPIESEPSDGVPQFVGNTAFVAQSLLLRSAESRQELEALMSSGRRDW
jgi:hypothetical protein